MINIHVYAVLRVTDGLTGKPVAANAIRCFINEGRQTMPVCKTGGYFAFTDLPVGDCRITLKGAGFTDEIVEFRVSESGCPMLSVTMKPVASRICGSSAARLSIKAAEPGTRIWIAVRSKGVELKLAQDKAQAGDTAARLFYRAAAEERLFPGNYLAADRDSTEVVLVKNAGGGEVEFGAPLAFEHRRSVPFYPAQSYHIGENGCVTAYFREPVPVTVFDAQTRKSVEIELAEGDNELVVQ